MLWCLRLFPRLFHIDNLIIIDYLDYGDLFKVLQMVNRLTTVFKENTFPYGDIYICATSRSGRPSSTSTIMLQKAISSVVQHGLGLNAGILNAANGNCLFDSLINDIKSRKCFKTKITESSNKTHKKSKTRS